MGKKRRAGSQISFETDYRQISQKQLEPKVKVERLKLPTYSGEVINLFVFIGQT
ncbi:uncharacterized protein PHALS_05652 [Plasmopara halstedii]|uniref:Uncharacterized protein n=1 Tax=Plasmopara halstedii TaxID=4781 RepID=A0A0P1B0K4_PLAHL|nr:uncharacterized protein PHALS_05652 [Plasmopara halstedii]CEG48182.1 hypothetical protein PHALS_05652 [Plasmopara halstedii]|eukprot:XP_024584551.1 hypothetical protein PHALS_05652 [Plasmopara halstedii]